MLLFNILQLACIEVFQLIFMSVSVNQYCIKQVSRIELRCSEKKCVLVETVAVCEIKMVSEETINVLPLSSVLYKPHNYIKYHINIFRGPINVTTFIIKNYCQLATLCIIWP